MKLARLVKEQVRERRSDQTARAIVSAMIPGSGKVKRGDETTVEAARAVLAGRAGAAGEAVFEVMVQALNASALALYRRPFAQLTSDEQQALFRQCAEQEWTRWPFLMFAGLLKVAHFDNREHFEAFDVTFDRSGKAEPARWLQQVRGPDDVEDGERIECDVVIIGTGAGGAMVGAKLAAKGYAVVFVEEGLFHRRDEFSGRALPAHDKFFRHGAVALGNTVIPVQIGKMVGGSTAINAATCFRTPSWVLDDWCERLRTDELSQSAMEPHFEAVESLIQVRTPPPIALGRAAQIFARGCEELGFSHGPIRRNVAGCSGEGVCDFGCPTDARQSMDISCIPRALQRGALVFCGARAERVSLNGDCATGLEVRTQSGKRFFVDARATIVAGGAVPTPAFLLNQGICNSSGQVGKNLSLHPATGVAALFGETVRGFDAVPQSYFSDRFLKSQGFLLAGAQLPLDVGGALLPIFGDEYAQTAARIDQMVGSTVITHDTSRRGRVRSILDGRPLITYRMSKKEVEKLHQGTVRLAEIYFAAGAEKVFPLMPRMAQLNGPEDLEKLRRLKVRPSDFITTSWHPLGSCQMGTDRQQSVVDLNHETHDVKGLFIVDGSTLPGPTGVNPQITIMALAHRAAQRIEARLTA